MKEEKVNETDAAEVAESPKDPNVYFVYTHVNKKESVRQYESKARAEEFFKQARSIGVVSRLMKVKAGKEERDAVAMFQEQGITVNVVDESQGLVPSLKRFGGKLLGAVGL